MNSTIDNNRGAPGRRALPWMMAGLLLAALPSHAVVLFTDDFAVDAENWADRDGGEMAVAHSSTNGNSPGAMQGIFDQDVFTPETDAFELTTLPVAADLTQGGTYDLTSFTFQFYADQIVPSDLILRFGNGSFTFFRGFTVGSIDNWLSFTAPLTSVAGWFGGTQANFDSVLANTTFIELQVTRNGSDAQTVYFDNFTLNGELDGGGGGGPSAVPEPNTVNLLGFVALMGLALRRFRGFDKTPLGEGRLQA